MMTVTEWVRYARKAAVALVAALSVAGALTADGVVSTNDAIAIVVAFAGALGVYRVPNDTDGDGIPDQPSDI